MPTQAETFATPVVTPVVYTTAEAAKLLKISPRNLFNLTANGTIRSVKLGARRLIPAAAIAELLR